MQYEGMVYRPPSEAYSLIVQVTVGCSHNKCTFCSMYKGDNFKIKSLASIKMDLINSRKRFNSIERIFLADGDALVMKNEDLVQILKYIKEIFPECKRVGIYGSPRSILLKTVEELKELKNLGVGIIYLGVESGSEEILEHIQKGVTRDEMVNAGRMVVESEIKLSMTLISGLGGMDNSEKHARESAKIINEIQPDYVGLLTLMLHKGTPLYEDIEEGKFSLMNPRQLLKETRLMVEHIDVKRPCVFRSNHASNYINLAGTLNRDKGIILEQIDRGLEISDESHAQKIRRL